VEAFESFVALTLEAERFVVSEAVKFRVRVPVKSREQFQEHGFEVDLVGARRDRLVLASVKSFFGSQGVSVDHVLGLAKTETLNRRYAMFNRPVVRDEIVRLACDRYGYEGGQVEVRLYVGKWADRAGRHRERLNSWAAEQIIGGGPIKVFDVRDIAAKARELAKVTMYRDSPALVAIKVLEAAGMLADP